MENESPLHTLVADSATVDEERLTTLLEGRVTLDPEGQEFRFLPEVREDLTIRERIVVALLAQRGLHQLNPEIPVALAPKELSQRIGAKGASVRPKLKVLRDGGLVVKDGEGGYETPPYSLDRAEDILGVGSE